VADPFPQNPFKQLELAIEAVFKSWDSPRRHLPPDQQHLRADRHRGERPGDGLRQHGRDSGTGVAFTRNPGTGENKFYGEFLINAQGEDVVAGIRTPKPASEMSAWDKKSYAQLLKIKRRSRSTTRTCRTSSSPSSDGKLWMLQTRTASGRAPRR
jgi:pyruvate,orthophosphate dikinase